MSKLRIYFCLLLFFACCGGDKSSGETDAGSTTPRTDAGTEAGSGGASQAGEGGSQADAGVTQAGGGSGGAAVDAGGVCTYVPGSDSANCPDDLPSGCTQPAPSYSGEVSSIFTNYCVSCHRAGGMASDRRFGTYSVVYKNRGDILGRLAACAMPPSCAAQPSATERAALLSWLVCGAANN